MAINLVNPLSLQLQMHQQMLYQQHQMALRHYQQDDVLNTNGWPTMLNPPVIGPQLSEDVKIELKNKKLWQQFHAETTEMIITKTGRRMFPAVELSSVQGLESHTRYCVLLELAPASDRRHKYVGSAEARTGAKGWTSAGPAEPQPAIERRIYIHPDSPATGKHWIEHPPSFNKLKLTNNVVEHHSNVLLTSMHKYIPKIWIIRCDDITNIRDLYNNPSAFFTFRETEFIAVTAYQNENITKLKIDNNPFAKGFRETGQSSCKRKRQRLSHDDPTSSNSEISHDEEEGNVSSSDSDHDTALPSAKRSRNRESDESVSSSDNNDPTPPPPPLPLQLRLDVEQVPPRRELPQPRLHRPWTDNTNDGNTTRSTERRRYDDVALRMILQNPAPLHYHSMAIEIARFRQIQQLMYAAETQQRIMPSIMDFRR